MKENENCAASIVVQARPENQIRAGESRDFSHPNGRNSWRET